MYANCPVYIWNISININEEVDMPLIEMYPGMQLYFS